jgi:hypothetical protein
MQGMCCQPGLQDAVSFVRGRGGHRGLQVSEQSDLDCLAAFRLFPS